MNKGAWQAVVQSQIWGHQSQIQLSDCTTITTNLCYTIGPCCLSILHKLV